MWSSRTERPPRGASRAAPTLVRLVRASPWVVAGATLSGCVSGPVRTVRSNVEHVDSGPLKSLNQNNLLELAAQDHIGPDLQYRFSDTATFQTQRIDAGVSTNHDEVSLHRPALELALTQGPILWTQVYRMQQDRSLIDAGADNELVRKDILQRLDWTPDDLPQVTAWFNFRTVEDEFFVDQRAVESRLQVQQVLGPWSYSYNLRDERLLDDQRDAENTRLEHIVRGTYDERHLQDRLSTTVSVFATERDFSTEVPLGTSPTVQVTTPQGLSTIDLTPQVSTLVASPALVDGDPFTPAGIDIGGIASGGQLFWNLGAELPPGGSVDVIELQLAAAVPLNLSSQFSFSVWASDDNTFWTLVQGSAPFVYDPAQLHFRLSIPRLSNRYVKLVNTASPAAAPSVLVTEIELFQLGSNASSTRSRSDDSIESATGNFSWRLADSVRIGYDAFVQSADSNASGTAIRDELRLDNGLWAAWTPTAQFEGNVRVAEQHIDDRIIRDERTRSLLSVLTYRPLRTLDVDLSFNHSDRDINDNDDTTTEATQLLATAQLLRTLRSELLVERNRTEDATNLRRVARWIASASLIAQLTTQVELTLRARRDNAEVSGSGAAQIPDPSETRYECAVLYRPTERVIVEVELNWLDSFAGEGLDQRFNIDWIPFEGGSLDLQFDYDRAENRSVNSNTYDRWRALARWTLDARTYFELQYLADLPQNGNRTEVVLLSFNFTS
jgi:hypothetical protein